MFVDAFKNSDSNKIKSRLRGEKICSRWKGCLVRFLKLPQSEQFIEEKKNYVSGNRVTEGTLLLVCEQALGEEEGR